MIDELKQLFAYTRWANDRILDAAERLDADRYIRDLGNSFPSVRDTLLHVLAADRIWLSRWDPAHAWRRPDPAELPDVATLRERWAALQDARDAFLAGLEEAMLGETLAYFDLAGNARSYPLGATLRHVVNHATYHRGQVVTMLRQLGETPPSTDFVRYLDA